MLLSNILMFVNALSTNIHCVVVAAAKPHWRIYLQNWTYKINTTCMTRYQDKYMGKIFIHNLGQVIFSKE